MTEGALPSRVSGFWSEITMGAVPAKAEGMPVPMWLKTEAGTDDTSCTSCGDAGSTAWWELVVGPLPTATLTITSATTTTTTSATADHPRTVGVNRDAFGRAERADRV